MTTGIVVLGATGSIGTTTLKLLEGELGKRFSVKGLVASGRSPEKLAAAGKKHNAQRLVTMGHKAGRRLRKFSGSIPVRTGRDALLEMVCEEDVDIVVVGIPGTAALEPVYSALKAGKKVAMANKESLVSAGSLLLDIAQENGGVLLPVDSEHNAAFRILEGAKRESIHSLLLTASGGPFLHRDPATLDRITPEEAKNHPSWKMGPLVSINSATLMNKGLEVIEAMHLFGLPLDKIDAVIHPPSQVHAIVRWTDGTASFHASPPDMAFALKHALCWPHSPSPPSPPFQPTEIPPLTFGKIDTQRFPCYGLARESAKMGGGAPAVLNAANEIAVSSFLSGKLSFSKIPNVVENTLSAVQGSPQSIGEVLALDNEARRIALNQI
ncbi:1-deoxy-D-xylulose-5-phosphate reductoisomerase [bacterium]|nr:1-deoxy-D-xylulose-5-phosphate reductoisomerase [bacterium]